MLGRISEKYTYLESINIPREDGSIHNVNVVGTVNLCVGVNDRGTARKTAISAHFSTTDPVVGATGSGGLG